jgi:hypothetical protein
MAAPPALPAPDAHSATPDCPGERSSTLSRRRSAVMAAPPALPAPWRWRMELDRPQQLARPFIPGPDKVVSDAG